VTCHGNPSSSRLERCQSSRAYRLGETEPFLRRVTPSTDPKLCGKLQKPFIFELYKWRTVGPDVHTQTSRQERRGVTGAGHKRCIDPIHACVH